LDGGGRNELWRGRSEHGFRKRRFPRDDGLRQWLRVEWCFYWLEGWEFGIREKRRFPRGDRLFLGLGLDLLIYWLRRGRNGRRGIGLRGCRLGFGGRSGLWVGQREHGFRKRRFPCGYRFREWFRLQWLCYWLERREFGIREKRGFRRDDGLFLGLGLDWRFGWFWSGGRCRKFRWGNRGRFGFGGRNGLWLWRREFGVDEKRGFRRGDGLFQWLGLDCRFGWLWRESGRWEFKLCKRKLFCIGRRSGVWECWREFGVRNLRKLLSDERLLHFLRCDGAF
jgi:hypothetical protein